MFEELQYQLKPRDRNPREEAGIFSIITFYFTTGLIRKGYKKEIHESEIYEVIKKHESNRLGSDLEEQWEVEEIKDKPSLFRTLTRTFGKELFIFGLIQFMLKTPTTILRAIALQHILKTFGANVKQSDKENAMYYGIAFILCTILLAIYTNNYLLCIQEVALKIRVSLCSLIYRKCLRLKSSTISEFTIGNTVTLVSKDVREFENFVITLQDSITGVIQIVVFVYLMYVYVGMAAILGTVVLILVFPVQLCLSRVTTLRRLIAAAQTDKRLRVIEEVLSSIRTIKMYTWENYFVGIVNSCRGREILNLRLVFYLKSLITHAAVLAVRFGLFVVIFYYTHTSYNVVPANIYLIMTCMHSIRMVTSTDIPKLLASSAEIVSSMKRIQKLLTAEDAIINHNFSIDSIEPSIVINATIGVRDNPSFLTANLHLGRNLIALSGPLGSGTTLFIKTLVGDLPYKGTVNVNGSVSYAAQEPWLFPGTIRQNITFGKRLNRKRYYQILKICALEKDLNNFPKGDETVINDDGICLSRGQQGRINLARAIYKEADIYLLDNCLSNLDTHIKNHIFENCMKSFLKDKICIYTTNRDTYLAQADIILTIKDGEVQQIDNHENIRKIPSHMQDDIEKDYSGIIYESGYVEPEESTKLIEKTEHMYHEDNKSGKVTFAVYKEYLRRTGYFNIAVLIALCIAWQVGTAKFEYFIKTWTNLEDRYVNLSGKNDTNSTILLEKIEMQRRAIPREFATIMGIITIAYLLKMYLFYYMTAKASRKLHKLTFMNVIHASISFFDQHLVGTVINRFSKDIGATDEYIPVIMDVVIDILFMCVGALVLVGKQSLLLVGLSIIVIALMWVVRSLYMPACRSLKRLEAATRSPVIGLFRTTLEGVNTIRSSGQSENLKDVFDKYQNLHTSADYMYLTTNRAMGFCVEFCLSLYLSTVVILCLFTLIDSTTGGVGLVITQCYALTKFVLTLIRSFTELENQMTSLERILEYRITPTEETSGSKFENWPRSGKIEYTDVSLKYPKTNQVVLENLSFCISPQERVCIIGRTGAGKTSMLSTLFRLYETDKGQIYIDDTDISTVSLQTLRSGLSIIPQNPTLFTGDLRSNLDPNNEYDDIQLWKALNEVNFNQLCDGEITLQTKINEGGRAFSAGQKQLICFARALIKQNKVLILDEATSYLDNDTSDVTEKLIKDKFSSCTIITILHRLKTVRNYDKVMVLRDGTIVEFDSPQNLLNNPESLFFNIMSNEN